MAKNGSYKGRLKESIMKHILVLAFSIALFVLGSEAVVSQEMLRLDEMLQGYYRNPQPENIPEMLRLFDSVAKTLNMEEMAKVEAPIIGFFSEVFRANPDKLDAWDKLINGLSSKSLRRYLVGALCYADTDEARKVFKRHLGWSSFAIRQRYGNGEHVVRILKWERFTPGALDMCWGAFMASGNREYVKKVMECALRVPEDNVIDVTAGAARWSMLANADRHPIVAEVMNSLIKDANDASFRYFTEAMDGNLREKLLTEENRARIAKLNVPLPKTSDDASATSSTGKRKPLPPKGQDVNYRQDVHFRRLYKEAQYQHRKIHGGNGRIVKGKLIVEGQEASVNGVASKAVFAYDGLFVAPLYAGRTLRFVKHGYEPLDIELPERLDGIPGPDLDLGEQTLHRLPEDKTVSVQFRLELPEGVPQAQVELWTGELPSTWADDGYDEHAHISALSDKVSQASGKGSFSGLTPMLYELRIAAPGCMFCKKAFDAAKERDLGTIALERIRMATFQIAKSKTPDAWKEVKVPIDGKTEFVIADKPDQFGQYDAFRLSYKNETHLEAYFIYWPNFFDDYGLMSKEKYMELSGGSALPVPKTVKGRSVLEVGHFYRFRCPWRKHDVLLLFSGME